MMCTMYAASCLRASLSTSVSTHLRVTHRACSTTPHGRPVFVVVGCVGGRNVRTGYHGQRVVHHTVPQIEQTERTSHQRQRTCGPASAVAAQHIVFSLTEGEGGRSDHHNPKSTGETEVILCRCRTCIRSMPSSKPAQNF